MELSEFIATFAEQFEETSIDDFNSKTEFKELEEWSSLTVLTVIAMVDEEFGVTIKAEDIRSVDTIEELYNLIISLKK